MKKDNQNGFCRFISRVFTPALHQAAKKAKNNKLDFFITMSLDLAFLLSLFALNRFATIIFPSPESALAGPASTFATFSMVLATYLIMMIASYSIFKFLVIKKVQHIFKGKPIAAKRIIPFALINIILIGGHFVIYSFAASILFLGVTVSALEIVSKTIVVLLAISLYLHLNITHSIFAKTGTGFGATLKQGVNAVFTKARNNTSIILFSMIAFALLGAAYYVIDAFVLFMLGSSIQTEPVYLGYIAYNTILLFILGFGLLAFNRLYIYSMTEN